MLNDSQKKGSLKKDLQMFLLVVLSSLIYAIGYQVFTVNGNLYPGGFAGLATLIVRCLSTYGGKTIPFGLVYIVLNAGPTILVYKKIGKRFAIFSILQYFLVSVFTSLIPSVCITDEMFLLVIFGGVFSAIGISFALRAGASSGGTDFVSIYVSSFTNRPAWWVSFACNAIVLSIAGYCFGWEPALYSIVFQFINTELIKYFHNRYKYDTLYVVTDDPDEISNAFYGTFDHGITRFYGEGGYTHKQKCMLMITINEFEVPTALKIIQKADPKAFITMAKTERIIGNYVQQPYE